MKIDHTGMPPCTALNMQPIKVIRILKSIFVIAGIPDIMKIETTLNTPIGQENIAHREKIFRQKKPIKTKVEDSKLHLVFIYELG